MVGATNNGRISRPRLCMRKGSLEYVCSIYLTRGLALPGDVLRERMMEYNFSVVFYL